MKRICSKTIAVLLAVMMLIVALPFAASAETFSVKGENLEVGDLINYSWALKTDTLVVNAEFTVTYPTDKLELISDNGVSVPVLSEKGDVQINASEGVIHIAASNASTVDSDLYSFRGGKNLVSLKFRALKAGSADVELDVEFIGGKNSKGITEDEVALVENGVVADGVELTAKSSKGSETGSLIINDGEAEANIGEYVTYDLLVKSDYLVDEIEGSVVYNSDYLKLEEVYFPVITGMTCNYGQTDLIEFAKTKPEAPYDFTKEDVVIRVIFSVLAEGETEIDGSIEIMSGATDDPQNDRNLIVGGRVVDDSTSVAEQIEVSAEKPAAPFTYGDVDNSKEVNATDATLVLQHFAKIITLDGVAVMAANVNGDEEVNATDATLILQYFAKIITVFPVETAA